MKRGEVWWVNFEPVVGGEVRKERPAVIICHRVEKRSDDLGSVRN